ncbi:MAG: RidA family protein [Acidobacteriaceae bacterium]|nr:RidA family protein [Acidobacteriaceae bacterium]MBV9499216.1 RidA family protein [Acidobacteriaceae bacterium]
MKETITPEKPKPAGPYSPGIRANGFVFLSGQIPLNPDTNELVTGSIEEQTARVLENLKLVLEASGLSLKDVVKTTVFLKNMGDFSRMNQAYGSFFDSNPPARTTVEVARLPRDVHIEIEAIALDGHGKYPFTK